MARVLARRAAHSKVYPLVLAFSLLAPVTVQSGELSQSERTAYRNAISAAARGRSAEAVHDVRRTRNEVAKDVVQWYALQQGTLKADFPAYAAFIRDHADWPRCIEIQDKLQCDLMRKQAEARITDKDSSADIINFFQKNPPLTTGGATVYADALRTQGQDAQAKDALRTFWVGGSMSRDEQQKFFDSNNSVLTEQDREARVDRLLWDGLTDQAKAIIPSLSSPGHRALATARIALQKDAPNVAELVEAVPASHSGDPGLAYDRANRLAKQDNETAAARLLIAHGPATNGKASAWWKLRERVARELVGQGNAATAYRVASEHGIQPGDDQAYRDAEWTSGWIALRFVGDAEKAAVHFKNMYDASNSIISRARGAYWMGRAVAAQGNEANAQAWYGVAARFGTTFYGQMAAHELYGDVLIYPPTATDEPTPHEKATFNNRDMVRAVRVGVEIGNHSVAKAFMGALADSSANQDDATMAVRLGAELKSPDLAAWAAKRIGRLGFDVPAEGYPKLHFTIPSQPEAALIHAITRQESTFYAQARSGADAQGLMQLLPATAAQQARKLGISHQAGWLMSKPEHNVRLGSAYLENLIENFDGSYLWGIAGYNGGPGNARRWMERYGESGPLAIPSAAKPNEPKAWAEIDRTELISYSETRDYVQRVLEQTEVYRAILNPGTQQAHLQLRNNLLR